MSDDADRSQERQEIEDAIRARTKPNLTIPTSIVCLNCGEPTEGGARWCNAECRDDDLLIKGNR